MRVLLLFLLFVSGTSLYAQEDIQNDNHDLKIIQSFISDLANYNIATDVILSQHVVVNEPSDELYDYLEASLEEIRINLMSKKLKEIKCIPYAQMSRRDVRDIDPEGLNTDQMYFLHFRNRQMLAVYVEEGKIGSFTLVSKGYNKAHFVRY